jgi:hypothetical protein
MLPRVSVEASKESRYGSRFEAQQKMKNSIESYCRAMANVVMYVEPEQYQRKKKKKSMIQDY